MSDHPTRLLSLDPTTKGFCYVIFELPFDLVEWGRAHVPSGIEKSKGAIAQFEKLLTHFRPDVVVLEDAEAPGSRRCPRVRELIKDLAARAKTRDLAVHLVPRTAVLTCFSTKDARATKYAVATRLAQHFPQLAPTLPKPRERWESEKERMAIFDALALVVTHVT